MTDRRERLALIPIYRKMLPKTHVSLTSFLLTWCEYSVTEDTKNSLEDSNETLRYHIEPASLESLGGIPLANGMDVEIEIQSSKHVRNPQGALKPWEVTILKELNGFA